MTRGKTWLLLALVLSLNLQHFCEHKRICGLNNDPLSFSRIVRLHSLVQQVILDDESLWDRIDGSDYVEIRQGNLYAFGPNAKAILEPVFAANDVQAILVFQGKHDIGITCVTRKEIALLRGTEYYRLAKI